MKIKLFKEYLTKEERLAKYYIPKMNDSIEVNKSDLDKYDIPQDIKDEMVKWDIIFKSPFSDSFYNYKITGTKRPDSRFRVSDHWNFTSIKDDDLHCVTKSNVENKTHVSLGKYDIESKKYDILISKPSNAHLSAIENHKKVLKYLTDPETIYKKKILKERILKKEILVNLIYDGKEYSGVLRKWTGREMQIEDENGKVIFNKSIHPTKSIKLTDKSGNIVDDPYKETTL